MCGPGFYLAHTHNQCQVEPDYKALVVKKVFQHTDIGFYIKRMVLLLSQ